jgi:phage terminase large subunit-like protein
VHWSIRSLAARDGDNVVVARDISFANTAFPSDSFLNSITERYQHTRLWRQEVRGEILEDVENGLWSRELLDRCRLRDATGRPVHITPDSIHRASERTSDETDHLMIHCGVA